MLILPLNQHCVFIVLDLFKANISANKISLPQGQI